MCGPSTDTNRCGGVIVRTNRAVGHVMARLLPAVIGCERHPWSCIWYEISGHVEGIITAGRNNEAERRSAVPESTVVSI